ncbi:endonuclease V [Marinigracilibium pacificum]|uniref:Endonuclease V n=1 Tax=Marinigracilibium pacificum TaxID=2729599 RepID=A0A848IVD3_9BACT|nr:endonuclease V [Marinigracilibium pacificum]NMM47646.1 endonuclease V [Marinigracilibium pacificum]
MILAFDTYYFKDKAKTVCLTFKDWSDSEPTNSYEEIKDGIAEYEPGAFYKRELPCILSLLNKVKREFKYIKAIVIDGFVVLDDQNKLGLGGHLFNQLNSNIPIIGVAKSGFHGNKENVKELFRGESKKPLYITAIGIELETAFKHIKSMHGDFRMPTLLQILDTKTKEKVGNRVDGREP